MKFTVIMASYLGAYPGSASNREAKFLRSVKSFINQTLDQNERELIIVSDGCNITNRLFYENYRQYPNIKLIPIPKQPFYSGEMRNVAFNESKGDIITYLDTDDVLGKKHLEIISEQFDINKWDWVYYDDYMTLDKEFKKLHIRKVEPRYTSIGSSSISHKNPKLLGDKGRRLRWSIGYGHDFCFVMKLNALGLSFRKLDRIPQYIVAHYFQGDF